MPGAFVPPPRRPADACLPDTMDMPFGIFTVRMDENFTVLAGNGRYYEMIGYTPEQLRDELNNQAARYMHPDSLEAVRSAVQEAIRQGKATLSFENKIIRRDGKTVWMTVEGAFADSSDGRIMRGYILDGTSRKEAEERSRLNEERYRIAIALTGSCIWEYDFASHSIFQMDGSLSKYTLHDAIIPDVPASIIQSGVVHADFAEDLRAMYRRLEEGAQFGEWIGKIRRAAGGYSWTKITYASIFDDSGRPVRAVGVSEDIDQKMREDREIRRKIAAATSFDLEASAELSPDTAWLLDQAPEIVYVSDPVTYDMLYMNAAGLAAIGLPAKDIGGQKCYKALYGLEAPCPFCVNSLLREDRWYSWEHDNRLLGRRYHLRGKRISWAGKPAHIELAVDISDGRYLNQRLADKTDTVNILLQCIDSLIHTGELDSAIQSMLGHIGEFYGAERAYILGLAETDAAIRAFNKWSRADGDAGLLPLLPPQHHLPLGAGLPKTGNDLFEQSGNPAGHPSRRIRLLAGAWNPLLLPDSLRWGNGWRAVLRHSQSHPAHRRSASASFAGLLRLERDGQKADAAATGVCNFPRSADRPAQSQQLSALSAGLLPRPPVQSGRGGCQSQRLESHQPGLRAYPGQPDRYPHRRYFAEMLSAGAGVPFQWGRIYRIV